MRIWCEPPILEKYLDVRFLSDSKERQLHEHEQRRADMAQAYQVAVRERQALFWVIDKKYVDLSASFTST